MDEGYCNNLSLFQTPAMPVGSRSGLWHRFRLLLDSKYDMVESIPHGATRGTEML